MNLRKNCFSQKKKQGLSYRISNAAALNIKKKKRKRNIIIVAACALIMVFATTLLTLPKGKPEEAEQVVLTQAIEAISTPQPELRESTSLEDVANDYFYSSSLAGIIMWKDLAAEIDAGNDPLILDIRSKDKYDEGHIKGAYHAAWGIDLADKSTMLPKNKTVYVYDSYAQKAGSVIAHLNMLGINAVWVKSGFYAISETNGYEMYIETDAHELENAGANFDEQVLAFVQNYFACATDNRDYVVDMEYVKTFSLSGDAVVIDIRQYEDFKSDHIDGAFNVPFAKGMHETLCEFKGKRIIVASYSGQTSGQTATILRALGYNAVSLRNGMDWWGKAKESEWYRNADLNLVEYEYNDEGDIVLHFHKAHTDRLNVVYNYDNAKEYNRDSFTIPSEYKDTLLTIDITAYDKDDQEISSFTIEDFFILDHADIDEIPIHLQSLDLVRRIDNSELEYICQFPYLKALRIHEGKEITDLTPISALTNLEHLHLECKYLTDITAVSALPNLKCLSFNECINLSDISAISGLTSIEDLSFLSCPHLDDISPISGLTNLNKLVLSGSYSQKDISLLSKLTNLEYLSLTGSVKDLSPISELTNLEYLHLESKYLTDITAISAFANLRYLSFNECIKLSDISSISGLTSIEDLSFLSCLRLDDISLISTLTNLNKLALSDSYNRKDISVFSELTNLEYLSLTGSVKDLSPISELTNLEYLYLSDASMRHIEFVSELVNLKELDLHRSSFLNDVSAVSELNNLERLSFRECYKLSDIWAVSKLTNLEYLDLWGCSGLTDYSALRNLTNTRIIR